MIKLVEIRTGTIAAYLYLASRVSRPSKSINVRLEEGQNGRCCESTWPLVIFSVQDLGYNNTSTQITVSEQNNARIHLLVLAYRKLSLVGDILPGARVRWLRRSL